MFLSIAAVFTIAACATSPTGRSRLAPVSAEQMDPMGAQAFAEMKNKIPVDNTPANNIYVKCVANAIISVVSPGEQWEIVVFKDDTANAFALPGRKIGVHTGMLKVATDASQLGAVLGHEVGHVIAEHGGERMQEQGLLSGGLEAANLILNRKGTRDYSLLMGALGLGAQFGVLLPHSRAQESEADTMGLEYSAKAGFDPRGAVQLWRNMEAAGGSGGPEFLSTHPSHGTRIQNLEAQMPKALALYNATSTRPTCKP